MTTNEILKECTTSGNVVKLPNRQLPRDEYMGVKKALEGIGGKWTGGKVAGFVFQTDPKELLSKLVGGEKVNLKKDFQFFATPPDLADELVQMAEIDESHNILEPSAGQGAIVHAINRRYPEKVVNCYELMGVNRIVLERIPTVSLIGDDFMTPNVRRFDRIVANPPFTKNQDIDHIQRMYDKLADGGILVSVASTHWQHSSNKKETAFREWLESVNAMVRKVPSGMFKSSGTDVAATIIVIKK